MPARFEIAGLPAAVREPVSSLMQLVFGPPAPARLPERVSRIIRQQQENSEVVISFAQIGAIIFFAVFYSISPKAFPPDVPFEPVPLTLAFYGIFTLWRTWLAINRRLTPIILTTSVIIDVFVLMETIWSFHLQYQAPPEIYLKAPTLMYIFIMIALRALRFEPVYVVITGAAAAVGWVTLVAYAVVEGSEAMITRSFHTYMTSHSVLIGAEVDKLVSILTVTGVLALAVHRARNILYRAAIDAQAAADMSRFFAPEVAGRIRSTEDDIAPGAAETRTASIMFIDMRGFTPLSERLGPHQVMALLSDYQDFVIAILRRHNGSIDKFMGDGVLASFGATSPSTTFAADSARAVEALIREARSWRAQRVEEGLPVAEIAAAVATGLVVFGAVGNRDRLEYTVIGETVNLAAKLEKHCKVVRCAGLMAESSLNLAIEQGFRPSFEWRQVSNSIVGGVSEPLDLVAI